MSINSGGEKVFPEEVEECVKLLPEVRDAVVVGVPHERFGQSVTAVIEWATARPLPDQAVVDHVRERLAGHKVPRHVVTVESMQRGPNGKADYQSLRRRAMEILAAAPSPAPRINP
jgi:fatty-acyl-CoA synthase